MLDPRVVVRCRVRTGGRPVLTEGGPAPLRLHPADWCQADALSALLADPRSGIEGVRVVSARPALLSAVRQVAARRGLLDALEPESGAGPAAGRDGVW